MYTNIERIIAKIDNDFNPNNSDWIPRVGAWVIDALMQLDCTPMKKVTKVFPVKDRICRFDCALNDNFEVYDKCGNKIKEIDSIEPCCGGSQINANDSSTGNRKLTPSTIDIQSNPDAAKVPVATIAYSRQAKEYPARYNVIEIPSETINNCRYYAKVNDCTIQLTFDADSITIKYETVMTEDCAKYGCELPKIPNNGKLIEAITYYCMYKMLLRGYKHPVLNLSASQYGTNPYYIWLSSKEEAKRSVINQGVDEDLTELWRSAFYIKTFNPRRT